RIGPNTSSVRSRARSSSMIAGATNVPPAGRRTKRSWRKRTRSRASMDATQRSSRSLASASITGPTWVEGSRGSPSRSARPARAGPRSAGPALPRAPGAPRAPRGGAARAGGGEGGLPPVGGALLGRRGRGDDHRFDPAGLGDERHDRGIGGGERPVDRAG